MNPRQRRIRRQRRKARAVNHQSAVARRHAQARSIGANKTRSAAAVFGETLKSVQRSEQKGR